MRNQLLTFDEKFGYTRRIQTFHFLLNNYIAVVSLMADDLIGLFRSLGTSDHDVLLEQFCKILKCERDVAVFFLESASWNVEQAVNTFISTVGSKTHVDQHMSKPEAAFDQSGAIPQGTKVPCGETLRGVWRFKNTGAAPWPLDAKLVCSDGNNFGFSEGINAKASNGEVFAVEVTLKMPTEPGDYYGQWRLTCGTGYFGDPIWVIVSVVNDGKGHSHAESGAPSSSNGAYAESAAGAPSKSASGTFETGAPTETSDAGMDVS